MAVLNEKILKIDDVVKIFNVNNEDILILNKINLNIKSGEFVSIIGASGCGKSTLLKLISGLEIKTKGNIKIGDVEIKEPTSEVGMVFQESRLFPWLTIEDNIEFGIEAKIDKKKKREIVESHIDLVGLKGFEKAYPHQLSGGMQQRASIARTLVNNPKILLLDEPFGALDALTRINMQQEILRIWDIEKTTMILVTHDIDEAIVLGDKVVIMSDRPGTIKKVLEIDLPRPRDRTSHEYIKLKKEIYKEFFKVNDVIEDYAI